LLSNCSNDNYENYFENYQKLTEFPKTENWEFKRLSNISYYLPPEMKIINNNYLVLLTNKNDSIIQIIDIDNGKLLKSFGRKGQGPGEFTGAFGILHTIYEPNRFWIYDATLRRLSLYNIKNVMKHNIINPDTVISVSSDAGNPFKFCCLNSDTLVAIGSLISRLCFYNSKGDTIKTNGYIPGKKEKNISNFVHLQAYQGALNTNFHAKKIVICNFAGDIIEIYDYEGDILKTIHGPDFFIPEYTPTQHYARITSLRCGYRALCSSSNYIYCIYSGEVSEDITDWIVSFGKNIFIFDWEGEPIKRVKTDIRLGYVDISEEKNTIYAICYDGEEFFIGYYELKMENLD